MSRGGTQSKYFIASFPLVPHQVDKDVDLIFIDSQGRIDERIAPDIDEFVKRFVNASLSRAAIFRAKGLANNLEPIAVVSFEQLGK